MSSRPSTARRTSRSRGSAGSSTGSAGSTSPSSSPRTRDTRRAPASLGAPAPNIELIEPLGYLDFAALASQARVIVTDSGGLQKEAYWYGVPASPPAVTEWVDTVARRANTLVDDDPEALAAAVAAAGPLAPDRPALYGDGRASERIAGALARRG